LGVKQAENTRRHGHLGKESVSYVINSGFSEIATQHIYELQGKIKEKFTDKVWLLPNEALHITLMDWFAPFVDYGDDPDKLFEKYRADYTNELEKILTNQRAIKIHFDSVKTSPVTIFVEGSDDGSFGRIRKEFIASEKLLPGTKPPANIVHTSIARFTGEHSLTEVENFLSTLEVDFTEEIEEFRLIRESKSNMLEYKIIDKFQLTGD